MLQLACAASHTWARTASAPLVLPGGDRETSLPVLGQNQTQHRTGIGSRGQHPRTSHRCKGTLAGVPRASQPENFCRCSHHDPKPREPYERVDYIGNSCNLNVSNSTKLEPKTEGHQVSSVFQRGVYPSSLLTTSSCHSLSTTSVILVLRSASAVRILFPLLSICANFGYLAIAPQVLSSSANSRSEEPVSTASLNSRISLRFPAPVTAPNSVQSPPYKNR